eukprot:gnl/TRDRNA2_/TRDRNA2_181629_c0_seq1.p1 gnl/TRDRNA2_/TRDRNA2_181629_c0~~gnl/TRDRNA2_/TRDRNA2_181629_c0_seq1.p1  ORF type:complete len:275 (+),score=59.18 gnl/TRDRNA2_/TRDRNA2_181629_c0_seq1:76-900(+)
MMSLSGSQTPPPPMMTEVSKGGGQSPLVGRVSVGTEVVQVLMPDGSFEDVSIDSMEGPVITSLNGQKHQTFNVNLNRMNGVHSVTQNRQWSRLTATQQQIFIDTAARKQRAYRERQEAQAAGYPPQSYSKDPFFGARFKVQQARSADNKDALAEALFDLAKQYLRDKKYQNAIGAAREAQSVFEALGDKKGEVQSFLIRAECGCYRGQIRAEQLCKEGAELDEAKELLDEAIKMTEKANVLASEAAYMPGMDRAKEIKTSCNEVKQILGMKVKW